MKISKKSNISKKVVNYVFIEIPNILHKYFIIQYQTDPLGEKDAHKFFYVDESLFSHRKGKAICILGAVDTTNKDFRFKGSYDRDSNTLQI